MEIGEKLRKLREEKGYTQQDISNRMGIDKSTYCGYETGKRQPDALKLKKLASILNVSVDDILDTAEILPKNAYAFKPTRKIPILGRIAAGLPIYAESQVEGYTVTDLNGGAEYFGLRVQGDSMSAARIQDGDILIVRRQDTAENGQIAVVMVDGDEATVKRWYQAGDMVTLMPQSLNPQHQPQVYDTKKTTVRIIGLVVRIEITL